MKYGLETKKMGKNGPYEMDLVNWPWMDSASSTDRYASVRSSLFFWPCSCISSELPDKLFVSFLDFFHDPDFYFQFIDNFEIVFYFSHFFLIVPDLISHFFILNIVFLYNKTVTLI